MKRLLWSYVMGYVVGVVLAIAVVIFARTTGLDRDRAFYPVVLIVIASYYGLFALQVDSLPALGLETAVTVLFILAAVIGFKTNMWIVAGALAMHGVFDFFHADLISNPGVPPWWPPFCLAFDVVAGGCLAFLILRGVQSPAPPRQLSADHG